MQIQKEDLRDALTEWERRWREEPERFQSESERMAGTSEEYGDGASEYLVSILIEQGVQPDEET